MSDRPLLLDLYCKAGGASKGYVDAGFEVIGVDIEPQPHYPFEFYQADAIEFARLYGPEYDVIHASPPCKVHTRMRAMADPSHADLVPATRAALVATGVPFVIENVPGCPLVDPIILCGSMFGLGVRRHRLFESNVDLRQPACRHAEQESTSPTYPVKRYHSGKPVVTMSPVIGVFGRGQGLGPGEVDLWRRAMGIDWMTRDEMAQAIPPAYTRHIGKQLKRAIRQNLRETA